MRVGIIFGGRSSEHEVSLMSSTSAINAIDRDKFDVVMVGITRNGDWKLFTGNPADIENGRWEESATDISVSELGKYIDFAFPILHGAYGEDGTIQGMFEMLDIPYAGCGVLASACAMDKIIAKNLFSQEGIASSKYVAVFRDSFGADEAKSLLQTMHLPLFVKPANGGSSIGITKVTQEDQLLQAVECAAQYDQRVIIEQGLDAREIEIGVIGNEELSLSEAGEIIPSREFYNYKAKYFDDGKSLMVIPADISEEMRQEIKKMAARAYKALDCTGFVRCDFLVDKKTDEVYINEINTIPGFTKFSMFPLLFEAAGIPYNILIERIIQLGNERYNAKNNRKTT